jgi:hypothetical protein
MEELIWRKSSRSYHWKTLKCVQIAVDGDVIWVRNSNDPDGPRVAFTPEEMDAFLRGVHDGEFDDLLLPVAA